MSIETPDTICQVCAHRKATGNHFGARTCEGCKSFFVRTCRTGTDAEAIPEPKSKLPLCLKSGTCDLAATERIACKPCRWKRCMQLGMCRNKSRYGRQPGSKNRAEHLPPSASRRENLRLAFATALASDADSQGSSNSINQAILSTQILPVMLMLKLHSKMIQQQRTETTKGQVEQPLRPSVIVKSTHKKTM